LTEANAGALQGKLMTVVQVDDAASAVTGASIASEGAGTAVGSLNSMSIESGRTMTRATYGRSHCDRKDRLSVPYPAGRRLGVLGLRSRAVRSLFGFGIHFSSLR
jgi:hypothetical protein